jgi:nucleoid DNA-binding protein
VSQEDLEQLAVKLIAAKKADPKAKTSELARRFEITPKAAGRILRAAGFRPKRAPAVKGGGLTRIVAVVARETSRPQHEIRFLAEYMLTVIRDEVYSRGEVYIPDFGRFVLRRTAARTVARPGHPDDLHQLPAQEVVKFRASPNWRSRGEGL